MKKHHSPGVNKELRKGSLDQLLSTEPFWDLLKDSWQFWLNILLVNGHFSFHQDKCLSAQLAPNINHIAKRFTNISINKDITASLIFPKRPFQTESELEKRANGTISLLLVRKKNKVELLTLTQETLEMNSKVNLDVMSFTKNYKDFGQRSQELMIDSTAISGKQQSTLMVLLKLVGILHSRWLLKVKVNQKFPWFQFVPTW